MSLAVRAVAHCVAIAMMSACAGDDGGRPATGSASVASNTDAATTSTSDDPIASESTAGSEASDGPNDDLLTTGLATGLATGGSIDDTNGGDVLEPGYAADVEPLLLRRCQGNCHLPGWSLVLSAGMGWTHLVDAPADSHPTMVRVAPGDPQASLLWHKLSGTHLDVGGTGDAMPKVGIPLSERELAIVSSWILDGARP